MLAINLKTQPEGAIKNVKPMATATCGAERSIVIIANFPDFTIFCKKIMQKIKANQSEITVAIIPVDKLVRTAVDKPGTLSRGMQWISGEASYIQIRLLSKNTHNILKKTKKNRAKNSYKDKNLDSNTQIKGKSHSFTSYNA